MAKPGLAQGFVQFGTTHEKILRHLCLAGADTISGIAEDVGMTAWTLSSSLQRLVEAGFIFPHRKLPVTKTGLKRPEMSWGLAPLAGKKPPRYQRLTSAERTRRYRKRAKERAAQPLRVSSVFDLGSIHNVNMEQAPQ